MTVKGILKRIAETVTGWNIYILWKYGLLVEFSSPISPRQLENYIYKNQLRSLIKDYKINLVLDVGANKGQFAQKLINELQYNDQIISFEPLSSAFKILEKKSKTEKNWEVFNIALGSENTFKVINVSDTSVFSSFLETNSFAMDRFGEEPIGVLKEKVNVERLDDFLTKQEMFNIEQANIFLKMDTQGFDLKVFEGCTNILENICIIQSEVSAVPIYEKMPHMNESLEIFQKEGFDIAGIYPVTRDKKSPRIIEFDCVMVRNNI